LNEDEKTVARHALLPNLPPLTDDGLVLTDSHYDSAPLHEEVCEPRGVWLVHPLRGQDRAGGKNRWWKLRQMPVSRLELIRLWEHHPELMRFVFKARQEIERVFGVLTCTAGGLANLPAWVRHLDRVRHWVGVKIILYNARLELREQLQSATAAGRSCKMLCIGGCFGRPCRRDVMGSGANAIRLPRNSAQQLSLRYLRKK
jgi:hypothetical protein